MSASLMPNFRRISGFKKDIDVLNRRRELSYLLTAVSFYDPMLKT